MAQNKNNPIIVSGGVRYRASVARRLGLIPDGKVVTGRSKEIQRTHTAPAAVVKPNPAGPVTTTTLNPQADPETTSTTVEIERPNNGASKALWTEYALAKGIPAEDLEDLKRDEIIELVDTKAAEATDGDDTAGDGSGE